MNKNSETEDSAIIETKKRFPEIVSFIMILFFSLLPLYAAINPDLYGTYFNTFGKIEIAVFLLVGVIYGIVFIFQKTKTKNNENKQGLLRTISASFGFNKHGLLLLLMYIFCTISVFAAPDRERALIGTDFRPDGLLVYTVAAVLFVFASFVKSKKLRSCIAAMYIAEFFIISLIMVQQYYGIIGSAGVVKPGAFGLKLRDVYSVFGIATGHFFKGMTGTFYNCNHMGYYAVIAAMLCVGVFYNAKKIITRIFAAVLCLYSFWIIIINDTFGCYLAIAFTLLVAALLLSVSSKQKSFLNILKSCIPFILLIVISITVSVFSGNGNVGTGIIKKNITTLSSDIKTITEKTATAEEKAKAGSERYKLWVESVSMIREKPLLGFGPDNLKAEYTKRGCKVDRAHNEFLEHAVSTGIPSLIFYIGAILWILIVHLKVGIFSKKEKTYLIGVYLAVIAYLVSALFGVFLFYTATHFFIMLGLLSSPLKQDQQKEQI